MNLGHQGTAINCEGRHFYLYMTADIFSRKIVEAEVYEQELESYASLLLQKTRWLPEKVSGFS